MRDRVRQTKSGWKGEYLSANRKQCTKYWERMMEVLRTKHPGASPPYSASLKSYTDRPPELVPVDITEDTVTEISGRLSRGTKPEGANSVRLKHWILRFEAASGELRLTVADFTEWIAKGQPPWASYRYLTSG